MESDAWTPSFCKAMNKAVALPKAKLGGPNPGRGSTHGEWVRGINGQNLSSPGHVFESWRDPSKDLPNLIDITEYPKDRVKQIFVIGFPKATDMSLISRARDS